MTTTASAPAVRTPGVSLGRQILNKVPEITLFFWLIKVMCTTVGETAADYLNDNLGFGLTNTTYVTGALLAVLLLVQFRLRRYVPVAYWSVVVVISVFGTLITDNLTDGHNVPLTTTTPIFAAILATVFAVWYAFERTLSIHSIVTVRREAFYWLAILFTFALGTAAGDLTAEKFDLGYGVSIAIFGAIIAAITFAHYALSMNAVLSFWLAYIMTRPLGASIGDFMSQNDKKYGGLGLGTTGTSYIFLGGILALVVYLSISKRDQTPPDVVEDEVHRKRPGAPALSLGGATFDTVVVALDGSPAAADAQGLAGALAAPGAKIVTAHVTEHDGEASPPADVTVPGPFHAGLERIVREQSADLVVVGAHEHHHLWPVNHARSALHHASCSVAVAPDGYAAHAGGPARGVIGVAYDETAEAEAALGAARAIATRRGAEVRVIEVVRDSNLPSSESHEGWKAQQAAARLAALEDVTVTVLEGDPRHQLREASGELDLLVMGEHHPGALAALLLDSTADRLTRHLRCPLLVQAAP